MKHDIQKICFLLSAALAAGLMFGYPLEVVLFTALLIIAGQLYRFNLIFQWIKKPNKNPLADSSGQIYDLHRELSRRIKKNRKRKAKLSRYVKQFRQASSAIPDAIVLLDSSGGIQWANRNAESLLGIRWPHDANLKLSDLIRDPKVAKFLAARPKLVPDVIEINSPTNFETVVTLRSVEYEERMKMILARDVSRLVKINRMHSDFVANVSHELKTPLTVLRGYLEILLGRDDIDDPTKMALAQMNSQSQRMQLIVNDLLYLSKLEDELYDSKHKVVDVAHLVKNILETKSAEIAEKSCHVELNIDSRCNIIGNENELHSAFLNLITNAINYTAEPRRISIGWREEHSDDGSYSFNVTDNGRGIAANHIPRLTERFYRVDDDRSRDGGGTGLGLAIVKHVINRHSAELVIKSDKGKGSTFKCIFPSHRVTKEAASDDKEYLTNDTSLAAKS